MKVKSNYFYSILEVFHKILWKIKNRVICPLNTNQSIHKLGIDGRIWNIINDFHVNTQSALLVNQCQSKYFTVSEGVPQWGVLSGILYLVFINDLLVELEQCNCRTGIFNINACAPSLADDVSCISTSPKTLQCIIDVCNEYSRKWCFRFNAKTIVHIAILT